MSKLISPYGFAGVPASSGQFTLTAMRAKFVAPSAYVAAEIEPQKRPGLRRPGLGRAHPCGGKRKSQATTGPEIAEAHHGVVCPRRLEEAGGGPRGLRRWRGGHTGGELVLGRSGAHPGACSRVEYAGSCC